MPMSKMSKTVANEVKPVQRCCSTNMTDRKNVKASTLVSPSKNQQTMKQKKMSIKRITKRRGSRATFTTFSLLN